MDAPSIQYARTEDGVNIAYWTLGDALRTLRSQSVQLSDWYNGRGRVTGLERAELATDIFCRLVTGTPRESHSNLS